MSGTEDHGISRRKMIAASAVGASAVWSLPRVEVLAQGHGDGTPPPAGNRLPLLQDCGVPCTQPVDTDGPSGFGDLEYEADGTTLHLRINLKNANPNSSYDVFVTCGPTHAQACGFVLAGTMNTDGSGNGSAHLSYPNYPFFGAPDDHLDLLGSAGDIYVARPIVLPARAASAAAPDGPGDPTGL